MTQLSRVFVMRRDLNTPQQLTVRADRLQAFAAASVPRLRDHSNWEQGISGPAVTGLSTIFPYIPSKFPILDILRFLQHTNPDRELNLVQTEYLLSVFAHNYSQLMGNGEDVL